GAALTRLAFRPPGPFFFSGEGAAAVRARAVGLKQAQLSTSRVGETLLLSRSRRCEQEGGWSTGPCLGLPGLVQSWAALPGDLADLGHLEMFRELAAKNQGRRDLEAWATCSQRQGGAQ
ncbi:hypothetical protein H1C71_032676, partial [Ictidomys tridecemlineatus]